jgi:alpha-tubulin suppressor-like RCC1 family protein
MIIKDLCYKQIYDFKICNYFGPKYCFARNDNEYNIYYYDIEYGVMKEYISDEKIIDFCCGSKHLILLMQSGKVYECLVNTFEREKIKRYIDFELQSFKNLNIYLKKYRFRSFF